MSTLRKRITKHGSAEDLPLDRAVEHDAQRKEKGPKLPWLCWVMFNCLLVYGVRWLVYYAPLPLPRTADVNLFSEERALDHVHVLSNEIGIRTVSAPELQKAQEYLIQACTHLAEKANRRSDLEAKVDVEEVSGAIVDRIFHKELVNVYRHLTNIVLFVAPKNAAQKPALLINAHFDSAMGSPGAADCASCVGIGLEVVRTLIEGGYDFPCPILLLLNGGEETLLQAAHGFMQQSKWRDKVGAFINIESTGSGGGPFLFQYTGSWTLRAFAEAVSFPRAMVMGQEIFELGIIPADTDFRMFSAEHQGKLPGVDFATILDATPYHSKADTLERLKKGTTQEYGQTILELAKQMMEMMDIHANDISKEKLVYVDLGHQWMLLYSINVAKWIHAFPFVLVACALYLSKNRTIFLQNALTGIFQTSLSISLAVLLPLFFGVIRTAVSGRAVVWYSHPFAAFAFYWPAALIGFVLPLRKKTSKEAIEGQYAGIALVIGLMAELLTLAKIASSIVPFFVALNAAFAAWAISMNSKIPVKPLMMIALFGSTFCGSLTFLATKHIMEKSWLLGSVSSYGELIPDAVIGGLNGCFVAVVLLFILPPLTFNWKGGTKARFLSGLFLWCLIVGFGTSSLFPYSERHPKRIFVNRICRQKEDFSCDSVLSVSSLNANETHLPEELLKRPILEWSQKDWIGFAPFDKLVRGMTLSSPPFPEEGVWGKAYPRLDVKNVSVDDDRGVKRAELELWWENPGRGSMRIKGPIRNWSIAESVMFKEENLVLFSQDKTEPVWSFWIEFDQNASLTIQMGLYYLSASEELQQISDLFPEWASVVPATSFVIERVISD